MASKARKSPRKASVTRKKVSPRRRGPKGHSLVQFWAPEALLGRIEGQLELRQTRTDWLLAAAEAKLAPVASNSSLSVSPRSRPAALGTPGRPIRAAGDARAALTRSFDPDVKD